MVSTLQNQTKQGDLRTFVHITSKTITPNHSQIHNNTNTHFTFYEVYKLIYNKGKTLKKEEKKRKEKKRNQRLRIRGWEQLEQKNLVLVLWEIGIQKTRKLQSRSIAITEPPQQGDRAPAPSLFITFSLISYTWNMVMISSSSFSDFSWGLEFGICLLIPLYL